MATSFLPFCATCEKQIIVPDNSVLYCSQRCRQQDNLNSSTSSTPTLPSLHHSIQDVSSSETLPHCSSRPSHLLVRSTTGLPRQRRDRFRPDVESDAVRYLSQFASLPSNTVLRTRRRPLASRSATSISTMATASTVASITTSSAPSLTHTPASSLGASAPVSPSRKPSTLSLRQHPSSRLDDAASNAAVGRYMDLITPDILPRGCGSTPASVPTIKVDLDSDGDSTSETNCDPVHEMEYKSNAMGDHIPVTAAASVPNYASNNKQNLSPLGFKAKDEMIYNKIVMPQKQSPVEGSLKQLLAGQMAQISL